MAEDNRSDFSPTNQLASILDQLACPACFSALKLDEKNLQCTGCMRVYPIVDGIPVLIAGPEALDRG